MITPTSLLSQLVIGTVESVAANEVRVLLEMDAPQTTALNAGAPAAFPRLNGYVLIPHEAGATVGFISWIGIERSPYPRRAGSPDLGLVDLPFPLRKMTIAPIGTLTAERGRDRSGSVRYRLSRGVSAFPSVGDQVLMPTSDQVEAIVGARDEDRRVRIGTSPMASSAPIMVDPDKIFGRHLAVLGNTGSGKSCSVAGLVRWSLDAAKAETPGQADPNARFIVLDPNGEYARAFRDYGDRARLFRVPPVDIGDGERPLSVPAWLWNGQEWTGISNAQPGAQRPLLLQAIREMKTGIANTEQRSAMFRRWLMSYAISLSAKLAEGPSAFSGSYGAKIGFAKYLEAISGELRSWLEELDGASHEAVKGAYEAVGSVLDDRQERGYYNDFAPGDLEVVIDKMQSAIEALPEFEEPSLANEDSPLHFDVTKLGDHLEAMATVQGGNLSAFVSYLTRRLRSMLADPRFGTVVSGGPEATLEEWLTNYVGADDAQNGQLVIVDLSLVPSETVHIVVAVLGRLVFEALQRHRREDPDGKPLPTVMVLEEAHTFVRRGASEDGDHASPARLCRETFERIAREGRKFGLGLVLSSQRPSELSPTVLAQCNTFLLHRLVNDTDQNLVSRLVPDSVAGLLRELPSLPSRQAVLLGWATPIPVLVEMSELPEESRPQSDDPDFWDVWTRKKERRVDWPRVAERWGVQPLAPAKPPEVGDPVPASETQGEGPQVLDDDDDISG